MAMLGPDRIQQQILVNQMAIMSGISFLIAEKPSSEGLCIVKQFTGCMKDTVNILISKEGGNLIGK